MSFESRLFISEIIAPQPSEFRATRQGGFCIRSAALILTRSAAVSSRPAAARRHKLRLVLCTTAVELRNLRTQVTAALLPLFHRMEERVGERRTVFIGTLLSPASPPSCLAKRGRSPQVGFALAKFDGGSSSRLGRDSNGALGVVPGIGEVLHRAAVGHSCGIRFTLVQVSQR
jgi:hypothetical protein